MTHSSHPGSIQAHRHACDAQDKVIDKPTTKMCRRLSIFALLLVPVLSFQYPATKVVGNHERIRFSKYLHHNVKTSYQQKSSRRRLNAGQRDNEPNPGVDTWLGQLVVPLLFVYISNQWSRSSLYYLVDFSEDATAYSAMNVALGFSESQYGVLASLAFTALFAAASLGAGVVSDRLNRKTLTILSSLGWASATLGTAFSGSYEDVLSCRVFMGLACAFTAPTAYTMIQDYVPEDRKALATSIYGSGVSLGGALASLSILLDDRVGWQESMIFVSLFATLSACVAQLVLPDDTKERFPEDRGSDSEARSPVDSIGAVLGTSRSRWIFAAAFLRFCSGLCIGVWSAAYFKIAFPTKTNDYALAQAAITAIAGSISGLLGGAVADLVVSNSQDSEDSRRMTLLIPAYASALAAPLFYIAIHTGDFQKSMLYLCAEYLVAECWFGPTITALLSNIERDVRGTAQGMFTMTGAIANLAPAALGLYFGQGTTSEELSDALASVVCLTYIASSICFVASATASRELTRDQTT